MKRKFQHYIDLIIVLTQKELKVRYKNSFFGYLWSVGQPLAFASVFYSLQGCYEGAGGGLYTFYYFWNVPVAMVC